MTTKREIRGRISSVISVRKVTNAMKHVAAARLRNAQQGALAAQAYTRSLHDMVKGVSKHLGSQAPMIWRRRFMNKLDILMIVSDRGLCGGFNEELVRRVRLEIRRHREHNIDIKLFSVGKKSRDYLHEGITFLEIDRTDENIDERLTRLLCNRFMTGKSDGAVLAFNRFKKATIQKPAYWDILPLHWRGVGEERCCMYLYEPDEKQLLDDLAEKAVRNTIRQALKESYAAELASRMMAMGKATRSADEMVNSLKKEYNRVRQESITSELMDIIKGAELLRQES